MRAHVAGADRVERRGDVGARLDVHGEPVGARVGERVHVAHRFLDHQVHVERHARDAFHGLHDHGTEADVRDEDSVHDVEVEEIGSCVLHLADGIAERSEVRGQDGRRNIHAMGHDSLRFAAR